MMQPYAAMLKALQSNDRPTLEKELKGLGFPCPARSATNLELLREILADDQLLTPVAAQALTCADPDLALNNLERLSNCLSPEVLIQTLVGPDRSILLTVLGASPFLAGILCRNNRFFDDLLTRQAYLCSKDQAAMEQELRERIPSDAPFETLQQELRLYKFQEILRIGSRDLCGLADLVETTRELSDLAAATLQLACEVCETLLRADFGAPLLDGLEGKPPAEAAFVVLGMGKFGGRELNFSSDIDLIYFYTSDRGQTAGRTDSDGKALNQIHLHQFFVKLSEMVTKAIGQVTADGFVFRVDLRLRPEGDRGEMANSLPSAETYYESWGQSWERSAMLKARPVAGSIALGEQLLKDLEPFIFRRYLDYGMLEDLKLMKQKIDSNLTRKREGEVNLKLGRGGIREIEFFIQAMQLVYAGKNRALRERNSLKALDLLRAENLIKAEDHRILAEAYVFLRNVEHRIQVVQERQTHNLPTCLAELEALARRCGFPNHDAFQAALDEHRRGVHSHFRDLFYTSEEEIRDSIQPEVTFLFDPTSDPDEVKELLREKGFANPEGAFQSLLILRDGPPHFPITRKIRRQLDHIAPYLMQEVISSPEPDMALGNLEQFIGALRARSTFYALLAENHNIIKLMISLFGTSQFLSRIFIQHPEIIDSLVSSSHAVPFKKKELMATELEDMMKGADDYELRLDVLRRYRKEEFLRIALNDLSGLTLQGEGTLQLSWLAEVCLDWAIRLAREELLPRYGLPYVEDTEGNVQEAAFAIVGLGKLGGMELNYHSDLDIIFIYEGNGQTRPAPGAEEDRFRQQSNPEYFSRLAQRIISALTLMTREGYVYQIDTRLRPSGNQGPLVTSLAAFEHYHEGSAQPWERQALTKARVVAGTPELARRIEAIISHMVYGREVPAELGTEIRRLRERMETEIAKEGESRFNIKTGRGGMVDVEFIVQYLQILHGGERPALRSQNTLKTLKALLGEQLLSDAEATTLHEGYKFLRRLENKLRLVHNQSISELSGDPAYLEKLARRLDYQDDGSSAVERFLADYRQVTEDIREVFNRVFGVESIEET